MADKKTHYKKQEFCKKVAKLSNKGWQAHWRIVQLDEEYLRYYKKVPKNFVDNTFKSLDQQEAKYSVALGTIKFVGVIKEDDSTRFKKLKAKGADQTYVKVLFTGAPNKGGASQNAKGKGKPVPVDDDDSDDEDGAGDGKTGGSRSKSKGSRAKSLQVWYFNCKSTPERDSLIAQIMINCKNWWERNPMVQLNLNDQSQDSAPRTHPADILDEPQTIDILEQYIEQCEKQNVQVIQRKIQQPVDQEEQKGPDQVGMSGITSELQESDLDLSGVQDNAGSTPLLQPSSGRAPNQIDGLNLASNKEPETKIPKSPAPVEQDQKRKYDNTDYSHILNQNIAINNKDRGLGAGRAKKTGQNRGESDAAPKDLDDAGIRDLRKRIDKIEDEQSDLEHQKKRKENQGWDLKFQNYWGYIIASDDGNESQINPQTAEMCEKLFNHVGYFRERATEIVQEIVEEMHKPSHLVQSEGPLSDVQEQKVYMDEADSLLYFSSPPESFGHETVGGPVPDQEGEDHLIYVRDKIVFKFTDQNQKIYQVDEMNAPKSTNIQGSAYDPYRPPRSEGGMTHRSNSVRNSQKKYQELQKWKFYGRQFQSMDHLCDLLYSMSRNDSYQLRVPLSALIDYKGFRCLAIGMIPIYHDHGPAVGFHGGNYQQAHQPAENEFIKQCLSGIGAQLKLKENEVGSGQNSQNDAVPISYFLKIYKFYMNKDSNQKKNTKQTSMIPHLSPVANSVRYHYNELDYTAEPFYMLNTSEIFPLDQEQPSDSKTAQKDISTYLRPEYLKTLDSPLKPDTLKEFQNVKHGKHQTRGSDKDIDDVSEASKNLKSDIITEFVDVLDNLQILPIDSESVTQIMHHHGINMRYLGHLAVLSNVTHVRQLCVTEMLARTIKNIVSKHLAELIQDNKTAFEMHKREEQDQDALIQEANAARVDNFNNKDEDSDLDDDAWEDYKKSLEERMAEIKDNINKVSTRDMAQQSLMFLVDMLNLVFGKGEETDYFWDEVLMKQTVKYFKIEEAIKFHNLNETVEENISRKSLNLNALFFAVQYHLSFEIDLLKDNTIVKQKSIDPARKQAKANPAEEPKKTSQLYQHSITQKMKKLLGSFQNTKVTQPFGDPAIEYNKFKFLAKSKSYSLKSIYYSKVIERMRKYQEDQLVYKAVECGKMRKKMFHALNGRDDVIMLAELAEIALDQGLYQSAVKQVEESLQHMMPLHAERVRFYCILIRAQFALLKPEEAQKAFNNAVDCLSFHLSPSHPLFITVQGIMAHLLIPKHIKQDADQYYKRKMEDVNFLYSASLQVSLKALGPNHVQTGDVYMDFARFYLRWEKQAEALKKFEQAYLIYNNYFSNKYQMKNSLKTADAAMQIATIMEEQHQLDYAFRYVKIASETYNEQYGASADITIISTYLKLQIAYTQNDNSVLDLAEQLYRALVKRDEEQIEKIARMKEKKRQVMRAYYENISDYMMEEDQDQNDNEDEEHLDELQSEIDRIKVLTIVTIIMEMTRKLEDLRKAELEGFCDKIKLQDDDEEPQKQMVKLKEHMDYKGKQLDLQRVKKVNYHDFKEEDLEFFLKHFKKAQGDGDLKHGFRVYFGRMIDDAIGQFQKMTKDGPSSGNQLKNQQRGDPSLTKGQLSQGVRSSDNYGRPNFLSKNQEKLVDGLKSRDTTIEFFLELLDVFHHVNFYNLFLWRDTKKEKENNLNQQYQN